MQNEISLGKDECGNEVKLCIEKEKTHLVLLTGQTGSGKSIFHTQFYVQLLKTFSPDQLKFLFLDMTRVDWVDFKNFPRYFLLPAIFDPEQAFWALDNLANIKTNGRPLILVHIEECDIVCYDKRRFENALEKLSNKKGITTIFSTSRPSVDVFTPKILGLADIKVVCELPSDKDYQWVLGKVPIDKPIKRGERLIAFRDSLTLFQPFTDNEIAETKRFLKID